MQLGRQTTGTWPNAQQALLLRAALGDRAGAREAWDAWLAEHGSLDALDPHSIRLLALVGRNLGAGGGAAPFEERLRGVYRYTWSRNHLLAAGVRPVVAGLTSAGLDVMALKGLAVALRVREGRGTRPMDDVDLLVRDAQAEAARDVLLAAGFSCLTRFGWAHARRTTHAATFQRAGVSVDLHWRAMHLPAPEGDLWACASPEDLLGEPLLVPAAEHLVVHACASGLSGSPAPVRWIADAVQLVRAAGSDFSWDRASDYARASGMAQPLAQGLRFMCAQRYLAVDPGVVDDLARPRPQLGDRVARRLMLGPPRLPFVSEYAFVWELHRRIAAEQRRRPDLRGYLALVSDLAGLDGTRALPMHLARRASEMLRTGQRSLDVPAGAATPPLRT